MNLDLNLNLAQKQKLVMTQTLREAIELLQMSSIELSAKIEQEVESNPILEIDTGNDKNDNLDFSENGTGNDKNEQSDFVESDDSQSSKEDDFDYEINEELLSYFEDSSDLGYNGSLDAVDLDSRQEFLEGTVHTGQTFHDYLLEQLSLSTIDKKDYNTGDIIISSFDNDGYLTMPLAELAASMESTDASFADFERILDLIRSFDPPGIGANDIQECLLLQIERLTKNTGLAAEVIKNHFKDLEYHRYKQIASKLGTDEEEIKAIAELIAKLEPRPGRKFDTGETDYVIPDVIVREDENGEFIVEINDEWIPKIRLSPYYKNILQKGKLLKKEKDYISDKISSAQWLMKTITQRKSTLRLVMEAILEEQTDFFRRGLKFLKPLTLKDISDKIEMHESTVSRITSNKYVQLKWGVFSLKYFFGGSLQKINGDAQSSRSVKELIKEIIDSERADNNKIYSDQDIVGILANRGVKIARRTVAKYRMKLNILPSNRRHLK